MECCAICDGGRTHKKLYALACDGEDGVPIEQVPFNIADIVICDTCLNELKKMKLK